MISTINIDTIGDIDCKIKRSRKFDSIVEINVLEDERKDDFDLRQLYRMLKEKEH